MVFWIISSFSSMAFLVFGASVNSPLICFLIFSFICFLSFSAWGESLCFWSYHSPLPPWLSSLPSFQELVDGGFGLLPVAFVGLVGLAAFFRDGIVAAPCPHCLVPPVGSYVPRLLQPPERGVQRGLLQLISVVSLFHDVLVDLIAVTVLLQKVSQNDGFRMPPQYIGRN